jgi:hypothetical protein
MDAAIEVQLNIAGPTLAQTIGTLCSCATYQDALLFGAVHVRETSTVSDHVARKRTRHVTVTVQRIVPIIGESFYATDTGHVDPGRLRETLARCHSVVPRAAVAAPSPPPRGAASKRATAGAASAATTAAAIDSGPSDAWGRMYCLGWARLRPDCSTAESRAQCIVRCAISSSPRNCPFPSCVACFFVYLRHLFIFFD